MGKLITVGGLIWLASQLVSWANPPRFEPVETWHVVKPGETFWSIACDYYDEQERYDNFSEWPYWVRKANEPYMRGKRFLQVGDVVGVPIEKRVK